MKDILLDNRLDVAQLSFEAEQRKPWVLSFDPQVEITPDEWKALRERSEALKRFRIEGAEVEAAMSMAFQYFVLTGVRLDLSWLDKKRMMSIIYINDDSRDSPRYKRRITKESSLKHVARLLLLDSSYKERLEIEKNRELFEFTFMRDTMSTLTPIKYLEALIILGERFKMMGHRGYPQTWYKDDLFEHSVNSWEPVEKELEEINLPKDERHMVLTPVNWTALLVATKIFKPELAESFVLNEYRWSLMKSWLRMYSRTGEWSNFLDLATNMYLLTAQKLELTPEGLKITMPEPLKEEVKDNPLPEQRSY